MLLDAGMSLIVHSIEYALKKPHILIIITVHAGLYDHHVRNVIATIYLSQ